MIFYEIKVLFVTGKWIFNLELYSVLIYLKIPLLNTRHFFLAI